jgi:hypothetical protein
MTPGAMLERFERDHAGYLSVRSDSGTAGEP